MRCKFCNTTEQENFSLYKYEHICDDCISVLNYHMALASEDIQDTYQKRNSIGDMWASEFNEGLEEYAQYRIEAYNKMIKEGR